MVDADKIRQKIRFIEENVTKLERLKMFSKEELISDFIKISAAKYLLQTTIEAMIDTANHIIARERFEAPGSAAQAFQILKERQVIKGESYKTYSLMAKFRNRIVHIYNEVDPEEIYKIVQNNLEDFVMFLKEITIFLG